MPSFRHRSQRHKRRAIPKVGLEFRRHMLRQARLAHAARSQNGHQTTTLFDNQALQDAALGFAANQRAADWYEWGTLSNRRRDRFRRARTERNVRLFIQRFGLSFDW